MTPKDIYNDIRKYCEANRNEVLIKKYSKYFKEGYDAYGLSSEQINGKIEEVLKENKINIDFAYDLADLLIQSCKYEETWFANIIIKKFQDQFSQKTFHKISHWFDIGIMNWAHSDVISGDLLAYLLLNSIIDLEDFSDWRVSDRKFKRRAVPVTMIKILKTSDNFQKLFKFIDPLMLDNERVVHQGLGWFLREAWKIKRVETEKFLLKWKDKAARLIFQYATEKMTAEEKTKFRKIK
jgi:3-methyladenine DNA glycosylase AlkD